MAEESTSGDRPTPDQLAGVYVYIEAEEKVLLPPDAPVAGTPPTSGPPPPSKDELAGVYVYIEAEEKTVPPGPPPS